jgi:hypothetical protein
VIIVFLTGKSRRREADRPVYDTEQAEFQRAERWGNCRYLLDLPGVYVTFVNKTRTKKVKFQSIGSLRIGYK